MASYQGGIGGMVRSNVNDFYANKRKIADELVNNVTKFEPIYDPWVGLAKMATAGIAGWNRDRLMRRQQEDEKSAAQTIANALQGDKIDYNALGGNQFTAPIAAELQLNERQQQLDRNQRRADGLFGQGLQQGSNGVEFIPGYLEAQQQLAGLRRNERESWTPIRDKQGNIIGQQNNNGKMDMFSSKNEDTGPFKGTAMDAQAMNILINGDPNSPEYAAAYNYVSTPKQTIQDGQLVTIRPDMSNYRTPGKSGPMQPAVPATGGQVVPQGPKQPNPNQQGNVSVEKVPGLEPKLSEEGKKKAQALLNTSKSFQRYQELLNKQGPSAFGYMIGDGDAMELQAAHTQLLMDMKEANNLGALQGPDIQLMLAQMADPNSWRSTLLVGKEGLGKQLNVTNGRINDAISTFMQANPGYEGFFNNISNQGLPNQQTTTPANNQNQKTRMRYDATTDSFVPVK